MFGNKVDVMIKNKEAKCEVSEFPKFNSYAYQYFTEADLSVVSKLNNHQNTTGEVSLRTNRIVSKEVVSEKFLLRGSIPVRPYLFNEEHKWIALGKKISRLTAVVPIDDIAVFVEPMIDEIGDILNKLVSDDLVLGFEGPHVMSQITLNIGNIGIETLVISHPYIKGYDGTAESLPEYARPFIIKDKNEDLDTGSTASN